MEILSETASDFRNIHLENTSNTSFSSELSHYITVAGALFQSPSPKQLCLCRNGTQSLRWRMTYCEKPLPKDLPLRCCLPVCLNKNIQIPPQCNVLLSPMSSFFSTLSKPVFEKFDLSLVSYQCSLFMPKLNLDILFIKIL